MLGLNCDLTSTRCNSGLFLLFAHCSIAVPNDATSASTVALVDDVPNQGITFATNTSAWGFVFHILVTIWSISFTVSLTSCPRRMSFEPKCISTVSGD